MQSDLWDVEAIAKALGAELKQSANLPSRIELRSDRLGIVAILRLFPDQHRVDLVVDVGRGKRKAYLGQISLRRVATVQFDATEQRVQFQLETGESLTVVHDGRFSVHHSR